MDEALTYGGSIRRLWVGEAELYRGHLLPSMPKAGAIGSVAPFPTTSFGGTASPARLAARSSTVSSSTTCYAARPSCACSSLRATPKWP